MTAFTHEDIQNEAAAELTKLFEHAKSVAASLLAEKNHAPAHLFVAVNTSREGPCTLVTSRLDLDFNDDQDCQAAMRVFGSSIGEQNHVIMAAALINQSWMSQRLDLGDSVLPRGHPDRQDVVEVSALSVCHKTAAAVAFLYSPNPNITPECWQDLKENHQHFLLLASIYKGLQAGLNKSKHLRETTEQAAEQILEQARQWLVDLLTVPSDRKPTEEEELEFSRQTNLMEVWIDRLEDPTLRDAIQARLSTVVPMVRDMMIAVLKDAQRRAEVSPKLLRPIQGCRILVNTETDQPYAMSIRALDPAIDQAVSDRDDPQAWYNYAIENKSLSYEQKIACIQRAVIIQPNNPGWWYTLGCHFELEGKDWYGAANAFNHVIFLYPNSAIAWFSLGRLWATRGIMSKAQEAYARFQELQKNDDVAHGADPHSPRDSESSAGLQPPLKVVACPHCSKHNRVPVGQGTNFRCAHCQKPFKIAGE